ncbi:TRAP transporter small permease subunit [Hydrogenophaga sp. 5NK40-0174]|uniref:TRAP transporter small permease n=1 Tax=Hydrogenophaga sp. 5NK40-0174 TaxID=3127649 RepID=UPI003108C05B
MHKTLEKLLNWSSGLIAAMALFSIMWLTFVDVMGRKFWERSVPGSVELTEILLIMVIFGALPLVSWRAEHVVFDSMDAFIPDWLKDIQGRLVNLITGGMFGFLSWLMMQRAERLAEYGDITDHLQISLAPVAWGMAALLALSALVHAFFMIFPNPAHTHTPGDAA